MKNLHSSRSDSPFLAYRGGVSSMQEGTHRIKGLTEVSDSHRNMPSMKNSHRLKEETHRINGSTQESDPHRDLPLPSMPEEAAEKVATRMLREMKSSVVTVEDFLSVVLQIELKMEGFFREIISKGKELANSGSAADMVIDATSLEAVGDTPIYVCAVYRPICGGNAKIKWYMMGDGLENGVEFLFDSPPPHSVGYSASVIVGSELYTVGGMELDKFYKRRPHQGISTVISNKLYVKDLRYPDSDWKEGPSMREIRMTPYVAVVNRKLYAFGSDFRFSGEEKQVNWHPWAEYLELSLPLGSKKWKHAGKNAVENLRMANGHAVLEGGKKILVYSSLTNELLLYDSVKDSWTLHSKEVGPFSATTFMNGIMYGAAYTGKRSGNYAIFAYDITKPGSQMQVVTTLDDISGAVYPCSLIPVGQDKLYVLMTPYEKDSFLSVVCFRYRIYKETTNVSGSVYITAVRMSKSKYYLPGVTDIVTFLAVPPYLIPDCCDSRNIKLEKDKKGEVGHKKGTKVGVDLKSLD